MPRGEETQEPQEGRDTSQEVNKVSERMGQAASQPESVVERERPVAESEAIEAELKAAVEAVGDRAAEAAADGGPKTEDGEETAETAADGGPKTEDGGEVAARSSEEISATPIPLPTDPPGETGDEISVLPVPIPGQPDRSEGEISATPIPLPGEPDRPANEVSATPIPLPRPSDETQVDEISATPIPLPRPSDETQVDEISATPIPLPRPSDETQVDEISATPIPLPRPSGETQVDEISATPIPLPHPTDIPTIGEEISASPVTQPKEDRGPGTGDRGSTERMEESSFKVESQTVVGEENLDGTSFKFFTPTPEDGTREETAQEVAEVILDETSFKVETPTSNQDLRTGVQGQESTSEAAAELETGEILDATAFKPIPAQEGAEEDGGPGTGDGMEESGSILIGEEEEVLQQIDLSAEATKEVEEYWEPPEMYLYQHEDGSLEFVDKDGNPIKCPPQYFLDKESGSGTAKAWYPGGKNVQAFDVPPFPGYKADEFYVKTGPDDSYILVDREGNPVPNQWKDLYGDPKNGFSYLGPDGPILGIKMFTEFYIYTAHDGTKTFVDSSGNPLKCPPKLLGDPDGGYFIKGPNGEKIEVKDYTSPTTDIYLYTAQDGTKTFVDSSGNPIKCPPTLSGDPDGGYFIKGSEGEKIEVQDFPGYKADEFYVKTGPDDSYILVDREGNPVPNQWKWTVLYGDPKNGFSYSGPDGPILGIKMFSEFYIYTAQDGTKTFVDSSGNPLKCPPTLSGDHDGGYFVKGPDGEKFEVKDYTSPTTAIYIYTGQDGRKTVVDSAGNPIKCPPPIYGDAEGGTLTKGAEGQKIKIPDFIPPITDIYVYTTADGSITVVDKYGDPVKSPPYTWNNPSGEGGTVVNGPDGKPLLLKEYKPISSHWNE